eukprot:741097-Rhodomonas_salina.2
MGVSHHSTLHLISGPYLLPDTSYRTVPNTRYLIPDMGQCRELAAACISLACALDRNRSSTLLA